MTEEPSVLKIEWQKMRKVHLAPGFIAPLSLQRASPL